MAAPPPAAAPAPAPDSAKPKVRYDWYQTESQVIVTVLLKNAPQDKIKVHYGDKSTLAQVAVAVELPSDTANFTMRSEVVPEEGRKIVPLPNTDTEYSLELELAHEIDPSMCTYVVSPSKIEVKLRKKEGIRWSALEGESDETVKAIPQAVIDASGPFATPPCPFRKDWNKIEKEISKDAEETPEGEAALNSLFQKIYGEGSDEVRKAMNKSFVESGGTVLSTNWNKVSQEKVEVQPPQGLQFKTWDS